MDNEFNEYKVAFGEVIQKCIDMKWITVNEFVSIEGVASQFANKMSDIKLKKQIGELVGSLVWLKNYHSSDLKEIIKLFK